VRAHPCTAGLTASFDLHLEEMSPRLTLLAEGRELFRPSDREAIARTQTLDRQPNRLNQVAKLVNAKHVTTLDPGSHTFGQEIAARQKLSIGVDVYT
jgi:hypothetical protein